MATPGPSRLTRDTPTVEHQTSQSSYRTGDLYLGRKALLEDIGRYRQVPASYLIQTVLGLVSQSEISRIRKKLEDAEVLKNGRWSKFPDTPSKLGLSESNTFEHFITIISDIFDQVNECKFSVTANPSKTPLSKRKDTSRPDAYIYVDKLLAEEEQRPFDPKKIHWFDIAISFEFKRNNTRKTKHDDEKQMIWNLHHAMREDPRRRFMLGITIEDAHMRLWCLTRALLTVSVSIDFSTSIDEIISLFYLIGSSTYERLGWDPTIKRIHKNGEFQYEFTICDEIFTTTRAISTFRADAAVGSGTRIYEAVDKDGEIVAIKDSWRDESRDPEGRILEDILEDISKLGDEEAGKAKQYFVAIRVWEDVSISGVVDITFDLDVHSHVGYLPALKQHRVGTRSDDIPRRIHARTVFTDVGLPLMHIARLSDSLTCLSNAQQALYYLHITGWVHRDFSPTNVLWVNGKGKLSDFEYAKKVDSKGSHDMRTGTLHFMALEVEMESYYFWPRHKCGGSDPPFRMYFLHDLESEWWTAIWVLFYHTDARAPARQPDKQLEWYRTAFPEASASHWQRLDFFAASRKRKSAAESLSDTYGKACIDIIMLADDLRDHYKAVEKSYPKIEYDNHRVVNAVHKKVSNAHARAIDTLSGSNIQLQSLDNFLEKENEVE